MSDKRFYLTRKTKTHAWLRWEKYGPMRRDLSMRVTLGELNAQWEECGDKADGKLYRHKQNMTNEGRQ